MDNLSTKEFYGQAGFPQPYIYAIGYVTSGGAQDTSKFFFPTSVSVSKGSTGVYTITHKIGYANRYIIIPTPIASTDCNVTVSDVNAESVIVRTFNQAGTATDTAFSFTIYTF